MNNPVDMHIIVLTTDGRMTDAPRTSYALEHVAGMNNLLGTAIIGRHEHINYTFKRLNEKRHRQWFRGKWQQTAWSILWIEGSITRDQITEYIPVILPF